ncbi:hypothetical protein GCM10009107_31220 [Ideonella azotifigens]|uniref:Uncharacterized protein n=2 Tax=Ideonella azotifigens TaxID=513160 RepID=A0ABN1K4J3_9BURK
MGGDSLLALLGRPIEDQGVQDCLERLARGIQPELDAEDREVYVDWIVLNELGLELGFDDQAYLEALDPTLRRQGPVLFSQVIFHADGPVMRNFPFKLPFGLSLDDARQATRTRLDAKSSQRRSYLSDFWRIAGLDVTVAYRDAGHAIQSVYCRMPETPWALDSHTRLLPTPEEFRNLFGLRWSQLQLRAALAMFGIDRHLASVRREHVADMRREYGIELYFTEGRRIVGSDRRYPNAQVFSAVTYYAARELDSLCWTGPLPFDLNFSDTQQDLVRKVGHRPVVHEDALLSGHAVWCFEDGTGLNVLYSNLENRLLRVTWMAPGFWSKDEPEAVVDHGEKGRGARA